MEVISVQQSSLTLELLPLPPRLLFVGADAHGVLIIFRKELLQL
jgi:hypothetical protein